MKKFNEFSKLNENDSQYPYLAFIVNHLSLPQNRKKSEWYIDIISSREMERSLNMSTHFIPRFQHQEVSSIINNFVDIYDTTIDSYMGENPEKDLLEFARQFFSKKKLMEKFDIFVNESWGNGNTTFNYDFTPSNDPYEYIGFNESPHNGNVDIEVYDDVYEFGENLPRTELENYISLETLKEMLPVYNDVDFFHDWSVRIYKKDNYFLLQNSGWLYLFRKK